MGSNRQQDAAWVAGGFGVQFAAQIARAIVLAHLLSTSDLGIYFVLRSVAGVFSLVLALGLGQIGLRHVAAAASAASARRVVHETLRLTAAASLIVVPAAWLGIRAFGIGVIDSALVAATVAALGWTGLLADLVRGLGRVRTTAAIEKVFGSAVEVGALALVLVILRWGDLTMALGVTAAAAAVPAGWLAMELRHALALPAENVEPEPDHAAVRISSRQILSESWPVAANALLWRALAEVDLWIVAWLTDADRTAVYGIATRLAAPLELPKTIAIYLLSPTIAALHARGERQSLERELKLWARRASVGCIGLLSVLLVIGPNGIDAIFGEGYRRATPLLLVLAIGQLVNVGAGLGGTTLLMTGHARTLLRISVLSSSLGATSAMLLIPAVGIVGAAAASAAGRSIQSVLMVRAVRRYSDVSVHAGPRFS